MASTSFKTTLVITKAVAQKNIPMKAQCLAVKLFENLAKIHFFNLLLNILISF